MIGQPPLTKSAASDAITFGDADPRIAYNRVFFALLRINRSLLPPIERVLRDMGIADPIWYEILLAAEEAGDAGLQMIALQERLSVAQYSLSRHIARLERAGWLRTEASPGAGRGRTVYLTEAARGLHSKVWVVYVEAIQSALGPRLSTGEAYTLVRLLNRLYP